MFKTRVVIGENSLCKFETKWISKASAIQRSGRCGRVGPGHCYRLYTQALHTEGFERHQPSQLENTPLDWVLGFLANFGIYH